ncbi:hypothetical protein HS1genome_1997 [Sulfodiicoccus acidiphilus]|uniref:Uncharacterized protein n=1 Tax=Sulfodiicoccus acidiphilus TaxID=1670455 RepID=A0A348B606_9CREN|nr:hypothetical protein HS1genome_1997 [Sulfodiicoccus acidiphilus]GGU04768.1 hypothetical protein GCM10007116_21750 [Sulfodiicoccus acidiphilus]
MTRRAKAIGAAISTEVPPEPLLVLVNDYVVATRFTLSWLKENVMNPEDGGVLGKVHEELYKRLREEFNLPSKVAEDFHRDALSVYKGWYEDRRRGRLPSCTSPR